MRESIKSPDRGGMRRRASSLGKIKEITKVKFQLRHQVNIKPAEGETDRCYLRFLRFLLLKSLLGLSSFLVQNFVKFGNLAIFAIFVTRCFQVARKVLFLFLSLEFCQIWKSCYSCDICYSVLLGSKKNPFTFAIFAEFATFLISVSFKFFG